MVFHGTFKYLLEPKYISIKDIHSQTVGWTE